MLNNVTSIPQVLERVAGDCLLFQIYKVERECLEQIVDLALDCEWRDERWQNYERLKRMASKITGWNAKQPELRTSAHYEVVIAFIDWLLPESEASC